MKKIIALTLLIIFTFESALAGQKSSCNQLMENFFQRDKLVSRLKKDAANYNIELYGLKNTPHDKAKFESIYVRCMSPGAKEIDDVASKKLNNTFHAMSIGTMIVGYSYSNWDKPKDVEWFFKMGLGLGFGAAAGFLQNKLIKDTGNKYYNLILEYLYGRGSDVAFMGVDKAIEKLTTDDEKELELQLKIKNIKTNDDYLRFKKTFHSESWYENFRHKLVTSFGYLDSVSIGAGVYKGVDFNNLTPEQLQNEDIQKVVIAALIAEEKNRRKMAVINTGKTELDSFIFDSVYAAFKIPKDIIVNRITTQIICLNMHNQRRGFTQAVGLNVLNQVLFADYFGVTYKIIKYELLGTDENSVEKTNTQKIK